MKYERHLPSEKWISRKTNNNDVTILCKLNENLYTFICGYKVLQLYH